MKSGADIRLTKQDDDLPPFQINLYKLPYLPLDLGSEPFAIDHVLAIKEQTRLPLRGEACNKLLKDSMRQAQILVHYSINLFQGLDLQSWVRESIPARRQ